jgi:predicted GNAT superfamily acetyltransferase
VSDVAIREPVDVADLRRLAAVFDEIWGTRCPVVQVELLRAAHHAGGYLRIAEHGGRVVGGSFGFLARHHGEPALHSHVTGLLPGVRHTGTGRALKLHQRAWAAANGLVWIVWTFDPLVRRNAWFNLGVLGARVEEYLVNFYGPIDDTVNAGDETDRLLVAWTTHDAAAEAPGGAGVPNRGFTSERRDRRRSPHEDRESFCVATPEDIVALRRTDPAAAASWRRRLRAELGGAMAAGGEVLSFTRGGDYVVVRP